MGHHLPGDCLGALEVRLGRAAGAVDLSVRLLEPDQARSLARQLTAPHLKDFLVRWAGKDPALAPVRSIWLEFDQNFDRDGGTTGELPQPVVSAKLMPDAGLPWVMDTLLPALRGRPLSPALEARFRDCHRAIPTPGYLLYVFDLAPRGTDAVRLEIFGLDLPGIAGYLERIVPGIAGRVEEAVSLFDGAERLHLSIDSGEEEVSARIGIEGSFPRLPKREPRWEELFERLVDRGLCAPGKRDAALAWPGYDSFWTAPERWPTEAAGGGGFCVRLLSHLKVVSWPDREAEAKAYLLAGYQPAQKVNERSVRS